MRGGTWTPSAKDSGILWVLLGKRAEPLNGPIKSFNLHNVITFPCVLHQVSSRETEPASYKSSRGENIIA